jgi:hypothetical protein
MGTRGAENNEALTECERSDDKLKLVRAREEERLLALFAQPFASHSPAIRSRARAFLSLSGQLTRLFMYAGT